MESSATDTSATGMHQVQSDNSAAKAVAKKSAPPKQPNPAAPACPRCGGKLANPEELGWCPSCGYCRSLELEAGQTALARPPARRKPSPLGIVEFFELLGALPPWLWLLLGGIALVAVISVAANFMLPADSLARALWTTIQVSAGLLGLFAAQVWIFMLIAPECERLSAKDLILSARLWSMTWRRLPETHRQVWLGAWSMAAVLSATFLIGGFTYWFQFYKPKRLADTSLIDAVAKAAKPKKRSLEESVEDKRPTQDCVIIGYTVENDQQLRPQVLSPLPGLLSPQLSCSIALLRECISQLPPKLSGLVLATLIQGEIKFAGMVRRGIDVRVSDELLKRLAPLVEQKPFISGLNLRAIWVRPEVFCAVRLSGFDGDGRLRDPDFKDVLVQQ